MKKFIQKMLCGILAVTGTVACAGTLTACETSTPEVELTLSFNGSTYTLSYELNRKITPKTVEHFLTLVENGYYNGVCVHDYSSTKMYTGAYTLGAADELSYKNYYEIVKSYIPQSVWLDEEKQAPTYTLYGEFESNNFTVEKGALSESFGSLVMYYTDKGDTDMSVEIEKNDGTGMATRSYEKNSATSQFYISLSDSTAKNSNYCVFATLDADSVDELTALQTAIDAYITANYGADGEDEFVTETTVTIDEDDTVLGDYEGQASYDVPNEPIVVQSAKVTKY